MRSIVERICTCAALVALLLAAACGTDKGSALLALSITADSTVPAESASRIVFTLSSQVTRTYSGKFPLVGNAPLVLQFPNLPASSTPATVPVAVRAETDTNCVVASVTVDVTLQAGEKTNKNIVLAKSATACTGAGGDAGRITPQDAGVVDSSADVGGSADQGTGETGGALDSGVPAVDAQPADAIRDVAIGRDGNDGPGAALLRISKLGTGTGTVTGPSLQCGTTCNVGYAVNAKITLTATPDASSVFVGWTNAGTCAESPTCEITISGTQTVTAIFDAAKSLAVINQGAGKGMITSTPAGIACGTTCTKNFRADSTITLTATVTDSDSAFVGWTGPCSGVGISDCKLNLSEDRVVGAVFSRRYTRVSAGYSHTCALRVDGQVECWGLGSVPGRGDGQATPPAGTFSSVSSGQSHTCGVRSDGRVDCWGRNDQGQAVSRLGTFRSVAAGVDSTCVISSDGTVSCSGGIQKEDPSTAANPVPGVFTDIAIGYGFGCGLQSNGRVACWNWGPTAADNPVVAPTGTFTAISVGCGVLSDGTASCWGSKNSGQMSPPAGSFQSVSSSCGVRTDGEIMCWDSATGAARTPTFAPVPRGPFTQISVGSGHACALRPSGAIVCFGSNSYGQATIPGM